MIKVKFEGLDELKDLFEKAPEKTAKETQHALKRSGDRVVENTVKNIIQKKLVDTGKLSQAVSAYPDGPLRVVIVVDTEYAATLEFGNPKPKVSGKHLARWAERKFGNPNVGYIVAKKIRENGIKGRFYFKSAIEISIPDIETYFNEIFDKVYI
jgi:hypothetical protein